MWNLIAIGHPHHAGSPPDSGGSDIRIVSVFPCVDQLHPLGAPSASRALGKCLESIPCPLSGRPAGRRVERPLPRPYRATITHPSCPGDTDSWGIA
jgi:hypothetical protein